MSIRVGSLVFATDQGLGYLARDFYKNGVITEVCVVRHGKREDHLEWYPGAPVINSLHSSEALDMAMSLCARCDVMLFFETPFIWDTIKFCNRVGIPSILMPMHECMQVELPAIPSIMACPSELDFDLYRKKSIAGSLPGCKVVRVDVPVDVYWYLRSNALTFVHNAGNGGLKGRNGTAEFLAAIELVKSPANFVLRSQVPILGLDLPNRRNHERVVYSVGNHPQEALYSVGEVFVFPEQFNGLSLPLQEAYASGMMVMATDRFPNNVYLPRTPLIPCSTVLDRISPRLEPYDRAVVRPQAIADAIDWWYGKDITDLSEMGRAWGKKMSWEAQRPIWNRFINGLAGG